MVNDVERQLQRNRDAYFAGPHTAAAKKQALDYFDQQWVWMQSTDGCGSALLGAAGRTCIADRSRSGSWPWEQYYRDPIANDHF